MNPNQELEPADIDRMIAEGLAEIERGESIDGDEAFPILRERRTHPGISRDFRKSRS